MASMPISFAALLDRPDIWRGDSLSRTGAPTLPCGFPGLDAGLPGGGWPAGALTEILLAHEGIGELRLLGPALAGLSRRGLRLVWIAPPHLPYAPALAAAPTSLSHSCCRRCRPLHAATALLWIAIRPPRLQLAIHLRGSSTPEPFALEERHRVFACDRKAFARGVRAGMAVAAALALAPALRIAPRDPATETEALLGVAGWAAQFTPGVALEFPDGVLLEVSSSLKLFGGLESLLERLRRGLAEMGWSSVLAGAPTPRAAFWLARAGKQEFIGESAELEPALAALPLEVLRCSDETLAAFEAIGVRTLGELRALPREGVARRFGQRLLDDSDRALGRLPDPRNFFVPPARFGAAIELPAEVTQAEALLFAARRLIVQLAGYLAARSGGVQRV